MNLKNEAIAKQLETMLTNAMVSKFKSQGHNLTGKGIASLKTEVKSNAGGLLIQILGEGYMGKQDSGLKPGEVKMTSELLRDLEVWVVRRGMADQMSAGRVAFNVARNMVRIGMHSTNKRIDKTKSGFITHTIQKESPTINNMLFQMFSTNFDLLVTNMTNKMSKTIINVN
jgi:hypothetical protein